MQQPEQYGISTVQAAELVMVTIFLRSESAYPYQASLTDQTLRIERIALPDHADAVLTLQHLGQVQQQLGKLDGALDFFSQALDITRR